MNHTNRSFETLITPSIPGMSMAWLTSSRHPSSLAMRTSFLLENCRSLLKPELLPGFINAAILVIYEHYVETLQHRFTPCPITVSTFRML